MACPPKATPPQIPYDGEIVYYLRVHETGEIKIGTTNQWETRVGGLMHQFGTITLIATEPGYREREREMHLKFRRERIHPSREVFEPSPDLLTYIAGLNGGEEPIVYRALPPWLREVLTTDLPPHVVDDRRRPTEKEREAWADLL